jgi:putative sterol carrier protein
VARYLSPEWFAQVNASLAASAAPDGDVHVVVQQLVTGGPEGDVAFALTVDGGEVRFQPGAVERADATISEDYDTAAALYRGEVDLRDAFLDGRVKVRGNMSALITHQHVLVGIAPLADAVRGTTTY